MARNWNQAVMYAKGEYIKILCADDYFEVNLLERYVKIMDDDTSLSIISSSRRILKTDGSLYDVEKYFVGKRNGSEVCKDIILNHLNPIGEPTQVMFRRKDLNIGLFNTDFKWVCDIDFWLRLCTIGNIFMIESPLTIIRLHEGQETNQVKTETKFVFEERDFFFYNLFIRPIKFENHSLTYNKLIEKHFYSLIYSGRINKNKAKEYLSILSLKNLIKLKYKLFRLKK